MKRFICDEILRYKNPYPYVDGLLLSSTSRIANVTMEENERISGNTGFTLYKSLRLWMNGFTAFSVKPLRMATFLGSLVAMSGFIFALIIIIRKFTNPAIVEGYSSIMAAILIVGGVIMVLLGLIGEYIGRIYICINNSPQYVIRSTYNRQDMQKPNKRQEEGIDASLE